MGTLRETGGVEAGRLQLVANQRPTLQGSHRFLNCGITCVQRVNLSVHQMASCGLWGGKTQISHRKQHVGARGSAP